MLCLNISQTYAKINISTTRPELNLQTTRPQLEIDTEPVKVELHQEQGKLEIDNTPYRYSIGIKNAEDFARDNAKAGYQQAMDTIARIAQEGDRMARIESKEDPIVNMAAEANSADPPEVDWAQITPPSVNYTPGKVQIDVTPGKLNMNYNPGTVTYNPERGTVDVRIARYNSVKFWTTENKYDINA